MQLLSIVPLMTFFWGPDSNQWSHMAFSWHVFLVSPNLWKFLSLCLSCMALTFLKSTGQLLCRMSLCFGLPDIFSWLNSGYALLQKSHVPDPMPLPVGGGEASSTGKEGSSEFRGSVCFQIHQIFPTYPHGSMRDPIFSPVNALTLMVDTLWGWESNL